MSTEDQAAPTGSTPSQDPTLTPEEWAARLQFQDPVVSVFTNVFRVYGSALDITVELGRVGPNLDVTVKHVVAATMNVDTARQLLATLDAAIRGAEAQRTPEFLRGISLSKP